MWKKHVLPIIVLLVSSTLASFALAAVDNERPNLSIFQLRKVDTKELARDRAGKQIKDLATGAIHMRESLFVDANYVKCPAYAHLFKIIKQQQQQQVEESAGSNDKIIRQNVVESLAIAVTFDRIFYHRLFLSNANLVSTAKHFIEAAKLLEDDSSNKAKNTWLELIGCMADYMAGKLSNPQVIQFLREPQRAEAVGSLSEFKAIPVSVESQQAPSGLVAHLVKKYGGSDWEGRFVSADIESAADSLIRSLDDADTAAARRAFIQESQEDSASEVDGPESSGGDVSKLSEAQVEATPITEPTIQQQQQQPPVVSQEQVESVEEPREVDLVAPVQEKQEEIVHFNETQLAILKFIKMRLEQPGANQFERAPRLDMQLAFDFKSHWEDLNKAKLAPSNLVGRHAIPFLQDAKNVALAERVQSAISIYTELTNLLVQMKVQEDNYASIEDLRLPFEKMTELLHRMDVAFDIDDIRRVHTIWKAKYLEYSTMDKFVNSPSW